MSMRITRVVMPQFKGRGAGFVRGRQPPRQAAAGGRRRASTFVKNACMKRYFTESQICTRLKGIVMLERKWRFVIPALPLAFADSYLPNQAVAAPAALEKQLSGCAAIGPASGRSAPPFSRRGAYAQARCSRSEQMRKVLTSYVIYQRESCARPDNTVRPNVPRTKEGRYKRAPLPFLPAGSHHAALEGRTHRSIPERDSIRRSRERTRRYVNSVRMAVPKKILMGSSGMNGKKGNRCTFL